MPVLPRCTRAQKEETINPTDFFFALYVQQIRTRHTGMGSKCEYRDPEIARDIREVCDRVKQAAHNGTLALQFDTDKFEKIGQGNYGGVYVSKSENRIAVKVMKVQKKSTEFRNEVSVMKLLGGCSFVPRMYDYFTCKEEGYILMEPLEAPGPQEATKQKVRDLLQKMFDKGWFHCDNHNGNVMKRRATGELVLIDFGLSLPIFFRYSRDGWEFHETISAKINPANLANRRAHYLWSYQMSLANDAFKTGEVLSPIQGGPYANPPHARHYREISQSVEHDPQRLKALTPQRMLYLALGQGLQEKVKNHQITQTANSRREKLKKKGKKYFMIHPVYELFALGWPRSEAFPQDHTTLRLLDTGVVDFKNEETMIKFMKMVARSKHIPLSASILQDEMRLQNQTAHRMAHQKAVKRPHEKGQQLEAPSGQLTRKDPTKALGLNVGPARPIAKQKARQRVKQRRQQIVQRAQSKLKPIRINN